MSIATLTAAAGAEIVFTLLAVGLLLIAVRLAHPTHNWALPAGAAAVLLGAAGLAMLPLHAAGILMLVFAAASLLMEILMFPGVGIHAAGAGVSLLFAGLFLTGEPPSTHPALVAPVAIGVALSAYLAGRRSWRRLRDQPFDASPGLIGRGTIVLTGDGTAGYGVVAGQLWKLRPKHGNLSDGQQVRVTGAVDNCLIVEPARSQLNTL